MTTAQNSTLVGENVTLRIASTMFVQPYGDLRYTKAIAEINQPVSLSNRMTGHRTRGLVKRVISRFPKFFERGYGTGYYGVEVRQQFERGNETVLTVKVISARAEAEKLLGKFIRLILYPETILGRKAECLSCSRAGFLWTFGESEEGFQCPNCNSHDIKYS